MPENGNKTSLGLDENIEAVLCYALGWITGIIFLLLDKDNKTIKFHALQSIMTFLTISVASYVISRLWFIGFIGSLIGLLGFVLWIVLMIKAYQGEKFKLPFVGDIAEQQANR